MRGSSLTVATRLLVPVLATWIGAMAGCAGHPVVARQSVQPPPPQDNHSVEELPLHDDAGTVYFSRGTSGPLPRKRPLVVLVPGFAADEADYRSTSRALAAAGFVVAGLNHHFGFVTALRCMTQRDGYENVRRSLRLVLRDAERPTSPLYGRIDANHIGAMGHSYGGKLALWLTSEEGLDAVVAVDPVDGGGDRRPDRCPSAPNGFPRVAPLLGSPYSPPTLILTAGRSGDCAPSSSNGSVLFDAARANALEIRLPHASHTDFLDAAAGFCLACKLCPPSAEAKGSVLGFTRRVSARFFDETLALRRGMPAPSDLVPALDAPVVEVRARPKGSR
ncbi:MAG: hypothetical protein ACO3JL_05710 [Myxococcota bacterium]